MFKFLKDKLKKAVEKITKVAETDVIEEEADEQAIAEAKKKEQQKRERATELEDTEAAKEFRKTEKPKEKVPQVEAKKEQSKEVPKEKISTKESLKPKQEESAPLEEIVHEVEPVAEDVTESDEEKSEKIVEEVIEKEPFLPEEPSIIGGVGVAVITKDKETVKHEEQLSQEITVEETDEVVEETTSETPKKSFFSKVFKKKEISHEEKRKEGITPEEQVETVSESGEVVPESKETPQVVPEEKAEEELKKSFLSKVSDKFTKKRLTEEKFEELFWDLEMTLLENNVAVEVIEKIKTDMRQDLTQGTVTRKGIQQLIVESLRTSIESLFIQPYNLVNKIQQSDKRPYVITIVGVNGGGKTTTLAKIANLLQENDLSVVLAASDTFRAAAIDQLKEHANALGIKLISQGYGADPAAVAFDAIKHAEARNIDVVLIDTAGRLHSNTNLMAELEKVVRVAKPDLKIFLGESITGNDCVEQATEFNKAVDIDAIILSKADVDEKGGAAISVSYVTGKPILYLGVGQAYGDLQPFDAHRIIKNLGLS